MSGSQAFAEDLLGLKGRVALVTGCTGGIGTAICKKLADMGHKVATNYRNEEKARAWQAQMKADGYDIAMVVGGDNQMQLEEAQNFLDPLIDGRADYAKGNRFMDSKLQDTLGKMPKPIQWLARKVAATV